MYTPEDKQRDFFDDQVYDRRVPKTHELMKIKAAVAPVVVFRMLFLEYYANLSDGEVCSQCGINLLYQAFCGIGMDDEICEPTTLVEFRNRLGEKVFKGLFDELVRQLKMQGLLSEQVAAIDGTHMEADVLITGMMNLLRQGRKKALNRVGKKDKMFAEKLKEQYPSEQLMVHGKASKKQIQEEIDRTKAFISALKSCGKGYGIEELLEELKKLISGESKLLSFNDMDARWGYKRKDKPFAGYKAHASMDDSGIVTSVEVVSGETNESVGLEGLIKEDKSKGIESECVAADGLYDNADTYKLSESMRIPIYTPCRHGPAEKEKEYFFFDEDGCLRCRNYARAYQDLKDGERKRYQFYAHDCQQCLSKGSCLKKSEIQRSIWFNKCCEISMKQDQIKRKEALEKRKRIEAKFGEAKKWHFLRRARYRSRWKVGIQVFMTFFVMNAKRMVKLIRQTAAPPGSLRRVCLRSV
ncbi:MAG: transposase [bacterium]